MGTPGHMEELTTARPTQQRPGTAGSLSSEAGQALCRTALSPSCLEAGVGLTDSASHETFPPSRAERKPPRPAPGPLGPPGISAFPSAIPVASAMMTVPVAGSRGARRGDQNLRETWRGSPTFLRP